MLSAPVANQKPKLLFPALGLSVPAHLEGPSRPWGGGFSWSQLRAAGLQLGATSSYTHPPGNVTGQLGALAEALGEWEGSWGLHDLHHHGSSERSNLPEPPTLYERWSLRLYSIRAGRTPSQPSNPAPPFTDGEIESQKGDEICPGSHSRSRLPAWTLSWIHTEGREVDRQPDADPTWHCSPVPAPQPSRPSRHGL